MHLGKCFLLFFAVLNSSTSERDSPCRGEPTVEAAEGILMKTRKKKVHSGVINREKKKEIFHKHSFFICFVCVQKISARGTKAVIINRLERTK